MVEPDLNTYRNYKARKIRRTQCYYLQVIYLVFMQLIHVNVILASYIVYFVLKRMFTKNGCLILYLILGKLLAVCFIAILRALVIFYVNQDNIVNGNSFGQENSFSHCFIGTLFQLTIII